MEGDDREGLINATRALEETLSNGVSDIDNIITTYHRIKNQGNTIKEIDVNSQVPPVKEYKVDIEAYDSLYRRGRPLPVNDMIIENIKSYGKELKLGGNIVKNITTVQADSHEEFLARILEIEVKHREAERKNRYLKQAGFEVLKTFADYTFDQIEIPGSIGIEDLKSAEFVKRKENLILYGPVGTGKTYLATAIGVEACMNSMRVKFYRTALW